MSYGALRKCPQIKAIIEQGITNYLRNREDELVAQVQEAIQRSESLGQPVTQRAICEIVDMSYGALRKCPQIKAIIEQSITNYRRCREDELVFQVQEAIQRLKSLGLPVTWQAAGEIVGMSQAALRKHPQIKATIEQSITNYRRCREDELVAQVQEAIQRLESLGQPVTQRAICEIVGMSRTTLISRPQIKVVFERVAASHHCNEDVLVLQRDFTDPPV
jgi:hypothetical protein